MIPYCFDSELRVGLELLVVSLLAFGSRFCGLEEEVLLSGIWREDRFSMYTTKGALESIKYLFKSRRSCASLEGFLVSEGFENNGEEILLRFALLALEISRASAGREYSLKLLKLFELSVDISDNFFCVLLLEFLFFS